MIFSLLVITLVVVLLLALLGGIPLLPERQDKEKHLDEFGRDTDPQIDRIKQNYVNGVIDDITMEQALDDVMNGKPNSYGQAVYDPEIGPPSMPDVSDAPHHFSASGTNYSFNLCKGMTGGRRITSESFQIDQKSGEIINIYEYGDKDDFDIGNIL